MNLKSYSGRKLLTIYLSIKLSYEAQIKQPQLGVPGFNSDCYSCMQF